MDTDTNDVDASTVAETQAAPGNAISASTSGSTIVEKIDALHAKHFSGSRLGFDTELFNLVRSFTNEVKALVEEIDALTAKSDPTR